MSSIPQITKLREALDSASRKDVNFDCYITRARGAVTSLEEYVKGLEDANHTYMTQNRALRDK